ncbi:ribonuclease R family protein [Pseudomaricurvus sp. HS19]|uniref:ribonuclease R family protein n=1 Tax=Pseudomaricurvus sp. HS19 TaxID=2692626 RepID=UPI00136FFB2D|nr:ribonuclease R [Pseudomaricurvus sp. HS19]MYM64286.1 VacB/RNase II family 3'-5' exoribonuclease [Pseudomaricurvus sp. HS19]
MSKRKDTLRDPQADREARNYDNPIPSRELILQVLEKSPGPMTHEALCEVLDLHDEDSVEALRRRLIAMSRDGQLLSNRKRGFGIVDKMDLVRARVQGHKDGFGFAVPADGGDDLFLSFRQMRRVFDGDEVLVRETGQDFKGRREGSIVEVVRHNTNQVVGRLFSESGVCFVRPDNPRLSHDIMIAPDAVGKAERGQFVVTEIVQQPGRNNPPAGRVLEVLGDHMAPGMEIDVAIRSHGIPNLWPADVQAEARALPVEVADEDKEHRVDLRDLPFVTIDGEDARDFDDAVYCEAKKSGGWRLYVAIADVSHYVQLGSALDREAQERGTSVYFPDFVVPMLPEALSNGLCSLNPKVDRLSMVCEMTISAQGRLSGYTFYEGVIHSHARLTYTQVGDALEQVAATRAERSLGRKMLDKLGFRSEEKGLDRSHPVAPVLPQVLELHRIYKALRAARTVRGAIDFETVETRILFDADRKIERIVPVVRNDAHKLIEECMLAANVCAARFLEKHKLPGLYRVHEGPREEKLENLREFLGELGLSLPGKGEPKPENYQALLQGIEGRSDANLIQTVMLRSLSQAMYQPDNKGHFGLAYTAYAHFTSPIRRYPDLLVHRAIRHVVRSKLDSSVVRRVKGAGVIAKNRIYPYSLQDMLALGEHSSLTERRADEATREVVSWLKCEYLRDHVGDSFEGVVAGVTGFGLFVELKDLYVEGLIHITNLPHDYYHFEAAQHRLVGERTRQVFRLGDEVQVRVASVNLDDRKVDLELLDFKQRKGSAAKSGKGIKTRDNARRLAQLGDGGDGRGKKRASSGDGGGRRGGAKKSAAGGKSGDAKGARKPSKGNQVRKTKSTRASGAASKPKKR